MFQQSYEEVIDDLKATEQCKKRLVALDSRGHRVVIESGNLGLRGGSIGAMDFHANGDEKGLKWLKRQLREHYPKLGRWQIEEISQ